MRRCVTAPDQVGHRGVHALGVHRRLGRWPAEREVHADVVRDVQVVAAAARRGHVRVPAYVDRDARRGTEAEPVDGEQLGGAGRQRLAHRDAGVVGPQVDDRVDRDPALDPRLRGAVVEPHQLALGTVRVREGVGVRGEHVVAVPDGRTDQVGETGAGAVRGGRLHRRGRSAEQHRRGVEEVHAVLDEDAAAQPPRPRTSGRRRGPRRWRRSRTGTVAGRRGARPAGGRRRPAAG